MSVPPKSSISAETAIPLPQDQIDRLLGLIQRLQHEAPLPIAEARRRHKAFSTAVMDRMLQDGISYGQASSAVLGPGQNPLEHLNQDQDAVQTHMRSIDNDLGAQLAILEAAFSLWFSIGEVVGPYYAWRVALILRKAKRRDLELKWLSSWCRHFGPKEYWNGQRFKALAERFQSMSANDDEGLRV